MEERFMREKTTKNKTKDKKEKIFAALSFIILVIIIYFVIRYHYNTVDSLSGERVDRTKCPHKVEGNVNANLTIKYLDSPYCVWCWFEEPVLKSLVEKKGNSFKLERYDIRYCEDIVRKYGFSGTPSFVFSMDDGVKEYGHSGYLPEETFNEVICKATGDCTNNIEEINDS